MMDGSRFDLWTRRRFGHTASGLLIMLIGRPGIGVEAKRKKKKKKKQPSSPPPSGCTPSCLSKVCGQGDGCGGRCTVQAGCGQNAACIDGACVPGTCNCGDTNKVCQPDGSCSCPPGLKECPAGLGNPGYCHECCQDASSSVDGDDDCLGNANGAFCRADAGDPVGRCRCVSAARTCPDGRCGVCCRVEDCFADVFGTGKIDTGRDCVVVNQQTGEYGCRCRSGTRQCFGGAYCTGPGNRLACGQTCEYCPARDNPPLYVYACDGSPERCCLATGDACGFVPEECCSGVDQCLPAEPAPGGGFVLRCG